MGEHDRHSYLLERLANMLCVNQRFILRQFCDTICFIVIFFSFDDGDFDDAEEDEGLDDLENVEDVRCG